MQFLDIQRTVCPVFEYFAFCSEIKRAASAAEYHDTTLGGVTDGSTKFNITPQKL